MRPDEESTKTYVKTLNQQADTKLAVHENRLDRLESDIAEMKDDVKAMRQILAQAQGGWRMLMVVGGACGSLGAAISWAFSHIQVKP
jgi:phage shock protein A